MHGIVTYHTSRSSSEKLYGMAKVYKTDVSLRPVVSMIGTPEYNIAKFLDNLIKSYTPDRYLLKSTDHFMEKLKQFQFRNEHIVVTVASMLCLCLRTFHCSKL